MSCRPCRAPFLKLAVCTLQRLFNSTEVVNAVFVQQTMQVAKGDEEVLLLEKQKAEEKYMKNVGKIFQTLDTSGDGLLSWAEFEVLLQACGAARDMLLFVLLLLVIVPLLHCLPPPRPPPPSTIHAQA